MLPRTMRMTRPALIAPVPERKTARRQSLTSKNRSLPGPTGPWLARFCDAPSESFLDAAVFEKRRRALGFVPSVSHARVYEKRAT
jgi:hypothetical protein